MSQSFALSRKERAKARENSFSSVTPTVLGWSGNDKMLVNLLIITVIA